MIKWNMFISASIVGILAIWWKNLAIVQKVQLFKEESELDHVTKTALYRKTPSPWLGFFLDILDILH